MKKIPTLFKREFTDHVVTKVTPELSSPELAWVLSSDPRENGIATEKIDGACCAIIDGVFCRRYDAKKNKKGQLKKPPAGAIPCDDPDPVTGHWPHWVKVSDKPADQWYREAYRNSLVVLHAALPPGAECKLKDGTYEAVGPHFQGNPYNSGCDMLMKHGEIRLDLRDRSFEGIRDYLRETDIEGIVFWKGGEPKCKIKRRDFGFKWPTEERMATDTEWSDNS